ncbi:hypothetical protein TSAR_015812, partial [Trichomalopsis sarcophagae]
TKGVVEVDSIFVMVMAVSTIMRYYILVYHRFDFRDTMDACRVIWNDCTPNEHQIVRWFERKTWMLFKLLAGSGMFINVFCSIGSIVVRLPPDEPNGTERRLLPYRWFIEDREYHWLGYELIFGLQVLITHHLTVIAATVDTAGPLLMMISCGFFKALQERFFAAAAKNEMILCIDKLEFKRTIVSCSKFHQSVLALCKKIEVMTRMIFMVQLMCLGYNISLIGLKLTGVRHILHSPSASTILISLLKHRNSTAQTDPERFQYIPNLVLCLCQLFITQWASDYLLEQSEEVATATYFATLMSLDARIGGLLLIMVTRAQKPVQMTAGGVIKLSIERFGNLRHLDVSVTIRSSFLKDYIATTIMTKSEKSLSFKSLTAVFVFFHRLIGVLPLENRDFNFPSCQMLLLYFMFIGLLISVMFLRYCITRLIQGSVELDSVFVTVMATSTIVRYYILVYHRFEFRDAIDACRDIWDDCTPNEHQIVRWFERKSWILFKLLAGSGLLINVFCSIGSIVVRLPPDEPNGTERRMLPYKWFIEDREYYWMGYELIFGLQVLILHHLTVITATVDTAGPLLMLLSCGFFKALQERFFAAAVSKEKFLIEDELRYQPLLTSCSKFHQNVLNLCRKIEVIMRMIFMVQLMCLGYNISLIGLKLAGNDPERFQYIPNLVLCLCQLFITQWAADYLLEQSEGVATAAYFTTLMSLDPRIGGLLLTVITRAQKPVQITAGGVINLSVERFGNLITNAISFFMVLRINSNIMSEKSRQDECGKLHVFLLKLIGLLSFDGRSLNFPGTVLLSIYVHCSHLLVTSMYVCNVAKTGLGDGEYDIETVAETVGLCGVHFRFLIMFFNRKRIAKLLNESKKLWTELDEFEVAIIRSFVEKSLRLTHFYLGANGVMCAFYLTVSQFSVHNSLNSTFTRSLPYPFYADVQSTPWYELSVTGQMLGMIGICLSSSGVDTAAPFFIMVACGHHRSLCDRLQNLASAVDDDDQVAKVDAVKKIIECIVYHQRMIKFCKEVEKLTNSLFMVQLISTTYNMSLIGLKLVGDDPEKLKYLTVLSLLMCQLFMCQWAPDLLVSESESLARSAYFVPGSGDESKKLAKLIHILMMRSQRPLQLTAGGWINLSMECFGSMITSAMSFFTIVHRTSLYLRTRRTIYPLSAFAATTEHNSRRGIKFTSRRRKKKLVKYSSSTPTLSGNATQRTQYELGTYRSLIYTAMSSSRASKSFNASSRIQLSLFRLIGVLSFEKSRPLTSRLLSGWFYLCYCFFGSMFLNTCVHNCLRGYYNLEQISETVILLGSVGRFLLLIGSRREMERLLTSAEDLWRVLEQGERTLVARFADISRKVVYAYLAASCLMCSFYIGITPILQGNATWRVLPFEFYVEVQSTPWYELVLILEGIAMFSLALVSSLVDITAGPYLILMGCGHLRTLGHRLRNIDSRLDGRSAASSRQYLAELTSCIRYHQMIFSYCDQVQRVLGGVFVTQLISTTYNISLLGLKVIGSDPDKSKYVMLIGVLMLQLLFLQWAPDLLVEESKRLASDSFLVPPIGRENRQIGQLICIFAMRSQRPIEMKAAGYLELSMESFGAMLTNILSFFTVLHSIN